MPRRDVERWGKGVEGRPGGARVAERYRRGCFPVICTIGVGREGDGEGKSRSDKSLKSSTVPRGVEEEEERGKKKETRDYMRQPGQGRSYYAIILHSLLNPGVLNGPLVLYVFFWFVDTRFSVIALD